MAIAQTATFSAIPAGTYSLRVEVAGTQTLALAPATVTIGNQNIFTFYAAGTAQGQALTANAFRHYP
ncbi:MAG: hypothetical protein EAY68_03265 [Bacteroidetes bacterium]|nr:MAG: hypothetical protein EAY68_03265 [Bacteroidota bacterium]